MCNTQRNCDILAPNLLLAQGSLVKPYNCSAIFHDRGFCLVNRSNSLQRSWLKSPIISVLFLAKFFSLCLRLIPGECRLTLTSSCRTDLRDLRSISQPIGSISWRSDETVCASFQHSFSFFPCVERVIFNGDKRKHNVVVQ